jgi:alkylation response protein AidB-like acyl-CoA dehydrogenase
MALLNEEQTMLRDVAADWARQRSPLAALRKWRDAGAAAGYDDEGWRDLAKLGWPGIAVPEAQGGAGMRAFEVGLVLEQLGRTLAAQPLASTALVGARALAKAGASPLRERLLAGIAAGDVRLALAVDEGPRFNPKRLALRVESTPDGGVRLQGHKQFVLDGMAATHVLVFGQTGDAGSPGISAAVVPADAAGLTRQDMRLIDHRGAAALAFDDVRLDASHRLGAAGGAAALMGELLDAAAAGACAEMLGLSENALDITLDYMRTRVQFDRPIGSFQALQHRAADWFAELALARSSVEAALAALDADDERQRAMAVSVAKVAMNDAAKLSTNEMIQIHGGIGMTDEFDAGFFLKRARVLAAAYGGSGWHLERVARLEKF